MEKTGIVKEIDRLGRIVIPKEFRQRYNLEDNVEIIACADGVLLRNSEYVLVKENESKKVTIKSKRHRESICQLCVFFL